MQYMNNEMKPKKESPSKKVLRKHFHASWTFIVLLLNS